MLIIFFRAVILLFTLIVVMRLMGKRQIGEMQPYEFIITLLIAELACVPMSDISIPLVYGIVSVLAVFIIHQVLTIAEQLSTKMRRVISGKPSIVINKNGVDILELKRNNLSVDDLIESLRGTGNYSLDSVNYAIYESNGKLSVLENSVSSSNENLPLLIVSEGKVDAKNVSIAHLGNDFIPDFLKKNGISDLKKVEVLTIDGEGKAYLKEANKKFRIVQTELPERCEKW